MPTALPCATSLLVAALAAPAGPVAPAREAAEVPTAVPIGEAVDPPIEPQEFRAARAEIVGFDESAVIAALRLRLPKLPIERHGGPPPDQTPHVYLQLTRTADDAGALRVITSDGRAYERSFAVEIGQEVRVAASTAANLIFAVEQGAVAPDREDVAIPPPALTEAPPPAPESRPEPQPDLAPVPVPATMPSTTGPSEQVPKDTPKPPRWELGVTLHGAALLGVGPPPYAGPLAGAGGGLGLEGRGPRGFTAALELRGLGARDDNLGLGRLRIALAAGYTLRRGRFELPITAALSVEPWWATRAGAPAPILEDEDDDDALRRRPLIGGYVRVTPAVRVPISQRRKIHLRVGPRLEFGGSFVLDGGAGVVGLTDLAGAPRFRLGGLELSLGLELALQFGLPSR